MDKDKTLKMLCKFCGMLEAAPNMLTKTAKVAVAQEYDELRMEVIKNLPDIQLRMFPPAVVMQLNVGNYLGKKCNANNVDLLAFSYQLRNFLARRNSTALELENLIGDLREKQKEIEDSRNKALSGVLDAPTLTMNVNLLQRAIDALTNFSGRAIGEALDKLSGDFSYNSVAEAKQILQNLIKKGD